jgi:hypothetical protein
MFPNLKVNYISAIEGELKNSSISSDKLQNEGWEQGGISIANLSEIINQK